MEKFFNPSDLKKSSEAYVSIPQGLSNAINLSKKNNPDITISKLELEQSIKDIEIAESDLKPTATLSFERSYTDDLSATYNQREKDVLKATISWPFYSGGKKRATISKNQSLNIRKRLLLDNTIKIYRNNCWKLMVKFTKFQKFFRLCSYTS